MVSPDRNLYEPPYDDALLYESDLEPERRRSRPLVVLLGFVVLAAFAGVVWVAYNQGVQHGQTPVLTAEGPTRIPGEAAAPEATGVAPTKDHGQLFREDAGADTVTLLPAPEEPRSNPVLEEPSGIELENPGSARGGPPISRSSDLQPPLGDVVDPLMDSTTGVAPTAIAPALAPPPTAAKPSAGRSPSDGIAETLPTPDSTPRPPNSKPGPPQVSAVPGSSKPSIQPPSEASLPPSAVIQPSVRPTESLESGTPAPAPQGGSIMIQLGSFPNDGLAATAWSKIKMANQDLLGAYSPTIQAKEIEGKGTWYRLRVGGFLDKASARAACDQLIASGQACIIAHK